MSESGCLPTRYIHIVWLPIAAFALAEILVGRIVQEPSALPVTSLSNKYAMWSEAAARMQLLGLMLLYLLCAAAVVAKFVYDVSTLFGRTGKIRLLVVYGLMLLTAAILVLCAYHGVVPRSYQLIGRDLFEEALKKAATFGPRKFWSPESFEILILMVNVGTGVAVPALIAGGISCLAHFKGMECREAWIVQSHRLTNYVYMSAGFLVIGTVFLKTWTQYPGFLLDKEALASQTAIVNAYTSYSGIEYSVLLAAYAIPVFLLLSARAKKIARTIARTGLPASTENNSLHRHIRSIQEREKLTFSNQDVIKTIVAVLAPMISGSIASLSSILGKG